MLARRRTWIVLAVCAGVVLVLVGGIVGIVGLWIWTAEELPLSEHDREALLTASVLEGWTVGFERRAELESWRKLRYIDGSLEVAYEYDDPHPDAPYVASSLSIEPRRSDAVTVYGALLGGTKLKVSLESGVTLEARDEIFAWGDASCYYHLVHEAEPVGHYFLTCIDNNVFEAMVVGILFDETDLLHELYEPILGVAASLRME